MTVTTNPDVEPRAHDVISRPSVRHTIREFLQCSGAAAVLHRASRRLLHPFFTCSCYWFHERDLTQPWREGFTPKIPVEIRVATATDFECFRDVFDRAGVSPRKIQERALNGDVCFLGVVEGRLLHFTWLAIRSAWISSLGVTIILRPGESYGYNAYTVPEARGQGIQPAVVTVRTGWERAHQLHRHISCVRMDNSAGLKIYERPYLPRARPGPTVRRFRVAGLRGTLLTGLRSPNGPRFEFPAGAVVRRLGPFGVWVVPPA